MDNTSFIFARFMVAVVILAVCFFGFAIYSEMEEEAYFSEVDIILNDLR